MTGPKHRSSARHVPDTIAPTIGISVSKNGPGTTRRPTITARETRKRASRTTHAYPYARAANQHVARTSASPALRLRRLRAPRLNHPSQRGRRRGRRLDRVFRRPSNGQPLSETTEKGAHGRHLSHQASRVSGSARHDLPRAGGIIAATHHYWSGLHTWKAVVSAVLATVLWPLLLVGVDLHIH